MKMQDVTFYFNRRFFTWESPFYWIFGFTHEGAYITLVRFKKKPVREKRTVIMDPARRSIWELL